MQINVGYLVGRNPVYGENFDIAAPRISPRISDKYYNPLNRIKYNTFIRVIIRYVFVAPD